MTNTDGYSVVARANELYKKWSTEEEIQRKFLLELRELTFKYGISIEGCGCCGSPRFETADVGDERAGYLHYYGEELGWVTAEDERWGPQQNHIVLPKEGEQ